MPELRSLHPGAWWAWALGLAGAAALTTNVLVLALIVAAACLVVVMRRTDAPWALGFRQYLILAVVILVIRVALRTVMSLGDGAVDAMRAGFADGMQLATMIVCVGAANSLADPKRLLASLPAALHEIGTAVVIALSVFPQLVESVQRVRRARTLRPEPGRVRALRGIVVPVLEDAFDRSLALAASMEARGFGRDGDAGSAQRRRTGLLLAAALTLICVGMYATLDDTAPRWLAPSALVPGAIAAAWGVRVAGRRVTRTRYRPHRWSIQDSLVAGSGVATLLLVALAARLDPAALHPGTGAGTLLPALTAASLAGVLVATLPAWPAPVRTRKARA